MWVTAERGLAVCRFQELSNTQRIGRELEWMGGQVVNMGGQELLYYEAPRAIHAALLRGSTADEDGNISFEDEPCYIDSLNQARLHPSVHAPSYNCADIESVGHLMLLMMSRAAWISTRRPSSRARTLCTC